jgi:hypothetical protein
MTPDKTEKITKNISVLKNGKCSEEYGVINDGILIRK